MRRGVAAALGLLVALAGCLPKSPPPPDRLALTPVGFAELPGWNGDRQSEALAAFRRSCARRMSFADTEPVGPGGSAGTVADWRQPCAAAETIAAGDDGAARDFFETWFRPYRAANGAARDFFDTWIRPYLGAGNPASEGLFTGYYEAELRGSRQRGGSYQTPLLRRPPDLVTAELGEFRPSLRGERIAGRVVEGRLRPYETRAQIEAGALDRQRLAFLWVDDAVDAFFLQIQGSGHVALPDGGEVRVGYDGQNGQPYVAVGRLLVERGLLERDAASLPGIRAWLDAHPAEGRALMDENPSYVFFREMAGDGPVGSEGVVLTPGRSLAVDRAFLPLGAPIWLDAAGPEDSEGRLQRLLVAQDSGGAIRGPVRGDLFWGRGKEAEARAGTMRARGSYYLLLPKSVAPAPAAG